MVSYYEDYLSPYQFYHTVIIVTKMLPNETPLKSRLRIYDGVINIILFCEQMWAIPTVGWTCQTSPHGGARIKRSGSLRTCSTSHAGQEEENIARSTVSAIAVRRG